MFSLKKITAMVMSSLLLAGTFGMAVGATSDPTQTQNQDAKIEIVKKLQMDDAVETYPKFTFNFTLTQITTGTVKDEDKNDINISSNPVTLTASVTYKGNDTTAKDTASGDNYKDTSDTTTGLRTVEQTFNVLDSNGNELTGEDFGKPGVYVYTLKEAALLAADWDEISDYDSITTSNKEYKVVIQVTRDETTNALTISSVGITDPTGTVDGKVDAEFINTYQRDDNEPLDPDGEEEPPTDDPDDDDDDYDRKKYAFQISKEVKGDLADATADYNFTLTVTKNATESYDAVYTGRVVYASGEKKGQQAVDEENKPIPNVVVKFQDDQGNNRDNVEIAFSLKDNQMLVFDDFPVGTGFDVKETNIPVGYIATATGANGATGINAQVTATATANSLSVSEKVIEEGNNKVDVENKYESTPLTGIVTDNLSFILLIVVAVAGMSAYVVMKRRLRNR